MIMSVIARTLMALAKENLLREPLEPQFKHAIMTLASEAAIFLPQSPLSAVEIFDELIAEMVLKILSSQRTTSWQTASNQESREQMV
jgi:hypothetical protein